MRQIKFRAITPEVLVSENMNMIVEKIKETSCPTWTVKVYHWMLDGPRERSFATEAEATHFIGFLTNVDQDS